MQPNKRAALPPKAHEVATQRAIDRANKDNKGLFSKGVTVTGDNRVVSMRGVSYQLSPSWNVTLRTCVGGAGRIFKDGKDITVDATGKPVPKGKEARVAYLVTFATQDSGKTWKVDSEQPQEKPC